MARRLYLARLVAWRHSLDCRKVRGCCKPGATTFCGIGFYLDRDVQGADAALHDLVFEPVSWDQERMLQAKAEAWAATRAAAENAELHELEADMEAES